MCGEQDMISVCAAAAVMPLAPAHYPLHLALGPGIAVVSVVPPLVQAEPGWEERICPGCQGEGWGVSNAIILPLFDYLHISFERTDFLKIRCPVEPGLWVDKCISVTLSYHNTASEQELSLGWR